MNKAQATVRMETVQTTSILETRLREAARRMLVVALRAEADPYIRQALGERDENGRQVVVGNGLSQERTLQTSVGTMHMRQPRVDDGRDGSQFTSAILPRYVRRTMNIDAMVATLYLHGVSTTRMEEVLRSIVGDRFASMSPAEKLRSMHVDIPQPASTQPPMPAFFESQLQEFLS